MVGTYRFHTGHFTLSGLNILGNLGNPAADRLLLNLLAEAELDVGAAGPLPKDFDAEMDSLGIVGSP